MVYEDILKYLGQQNFAVAAVSGNAGGGFQILYNRSGAEALFCILVNNTGSLVFGSSQIQNIHYQLAAQIPERNILFIVVTSNETRDRRLTLLPGIQVWLVDSYFQRLYVYENQPADFFGLRQGIEATLTETPQARTRAALQKRNWPYVTIILIALNVISFIILTIFGNVSDAQYMVSMGAAYGPYIFQRYQFWRLITNMFMHFSIQHLLGNMIYLGIIGYHIEREAGHLRYFLIYMLSGFGASIVSAAYYYISGQNTVSAGASGAVYGLIGAAVYLLIRNRGRLRPGMLWLRVGVILIFLFYSNFITTGIDAVAHAAGFVFGILLAVAFIGGKRNERR